MTLRQLTRGEVTDTLVRILAWQYLSFQSSIRAIIPPERPSCFAAGAVLRCASPAPLQATHILLLCCCLSSPRYKVHQPSEERFCRMVFDRVLHLSPSLLVLFVVASRHALTAHPPNHFLQFPRQMQLQKDAKASTRTCARRRQPRLLPRLRLTVRERLTRPRPEPGLLSGDGM